MRRKPRPSPAGLLAFALLLLAGAACETIEPGKVRLEFPGEAPVDPGRTESVLLTNFRQTEDFPDLDLAGELRKYWGGELAARLKTPVKDLPSGLSPETRFEDESHWRTLAGSAPRSLIMTGTVDLTKETRKALVDNRTGSVADPFVTTRGWETRQLFTLTARLVLVSGETGRILIDRPYKETADVSDPKQPALFVLYDLIQKVKIKFFRDAFGAPRNQERYLLRQ